MVAPHAGGGYKVCDVAVMFVGNGAMVEQQLQQIRELIQRITTNSFRLHRQPVWRRREMREADLQQILEGTDIQPERRDERIGVRVAISRNDPSVSFRQHIVLDGMAEQVPHAEVIGIV